MTNLLHDARVARRFLVRNPGFTIAAVSILALGISLSATLFAIVRGTLIEPWPYRGYDRIVTVAANFPTQGRSDFSLWSAREIDDLRGTTDVFEDVLAGDARNVNLTYAGRPERVRAAVVTPNAFRMLGVPAMLGRVLTDDDGTPGASPVVLVNYRFWQTRLGSNPKAVGQTLRIADVPYTIVGVMPERFVFWDRDLWMPLELDRAAARTDRRFYVQGMLRNGQTVDGAMIQLRALMGRLAAEHRDVAEYEGASITLRLLVENVLRDLRPTLYLLLGAVALVLIVATANLANAMLAKGLSRDGELAIRRAIGGSALQIARLLLVESAMVGIAGGLCGAAAAAFLLPQIVALIPFGYVPAEAHVVLDWRVVLAATVCATGCGLIIGVVPALRASRIDPATSLRQGDTRTGSRRTHGVRDLFTASQMTLAIVVVGVAAAAALSLREIVTRDPGYRARDVWTARIALASPSGGSQSAASTYAQIIERLHEQPGVTGVVIASLFPVGALPTTLVSADSAPTPTRMATLDAATLSVSPDFLSVLQIPLLDGRAFADSDRADHPPVAIVTRALAQRLWADGRAVGSRVAIGEPAGSTFATIVGVTDDVVLDGSALRPPAMILFPLAQRPPAAAVIGVRTSDRGRALAAFNQAVRLVDANIPVYSPDTLEQQRLAALGPKLLAVTLLGLFAATVLILCSAGIYAVVSQSVQERRQELRIRLAFGAEPGRLFAGELRRLARLAIPSAIVGSAMAAAALRLIGSSFTGFTGGHAAALTVSALTLVVLSFVAAAGPAWRASHPQRIW